MASFFEKLKHGAAEAGKKAQVTVEVNRLRMQTSSLRKEIQQLYAQMGEAVYKQLENGQQGELPEACIAMAQEIDQKRKDIALVEQKIMELKNEANCTECGQVNPRDSKFCSGCGSKISVESETGEPKMVEAPSADIALETVKCVSCGHELSPDKKFCGNCGKSLEAE